MSGDINTTVKGFARGHWVANALRVLAVFVILNGISLLLPMAWIDSVLARCGVGHFPEAAVAHYLLRGAGFFALAFGGLIWMAASDVVRYRPIVITLIAIFLVGAPVFYLIGALTGLPRWWCFLDFAICLLGGGIPLAFGFWSPSNKAGQWLIRQKKLIVGATVLGLLAGGFALKAAWFPTIQNVWFQLDDRQLKAAPANLVIFRETRLASRKSGCQTAWMGRNNSGENQEPLLRYSGRNVPLQEIIPLAYQCRPSDVVMPAVAPTKHYDFLVTAENQPAERLREVVEKKTGFTADWQDRESEVWLLKVQNPNALQPSTNTVQNVEFKDGRLFFKHMPLNSVIGFMGQNLSRPLVDETQSSGYYDFSISGAWANREPKDEKMLKPLLDELGLKIVEGTSTRRMMVVHRK